MPSVDLLDMYLRLAQKYGMKFYFGLYDSGRYWDTGDLSWEIEDNKYVIDEVWNNYGHYKSLAVGISVVKSAVLLKGLSMLFMLWENNVKMCQVVYPHLYLLGSMAKSSYGEWK